LLALGVGAILSALTTKYRDLNVLISYGVTFWMYLSPIVYDITSIPAKYKGLYLLNPIAPVITHIRYALFSNGQPVWEYYAISLVFTLVVLMIGYRIFNHVARTFVDTI
ncbi:MAG: ABC transporter permease, partial [Erysipelotrichaceae bacterium]|nr:ABC transporter permease [Erysipelotrichaceae bacterium]